MRFATWFMTGYWLLVVWLIAGVWRLTRRSRRRVTPGTALLNSMDLLFDDTHRAAVEVIVEERTGYHDPEDKDGDLPQLERPKRQPAAVASRSLTALPRPRHVYRRVPAIGPPA